MPQHCHHRWSPNKQKFIPKMTISISEGSDFMPIRNIHKPQPRPSSNLPSIFLAHKLADYDYLAILHVMNSLDVRDW